MPPRAILPALPADLLARSPEEAVRRIAHELLAQAAAARDRLADPQDTEALHDFRVAIRRLRSTERAYRGVLEGSFGDKARKRLRKIARATGASRDLEVQLQWLEAQRGSLTSRHRAGASWLRERWHRRRRDADARLGHEVGADFDRLRASLEKRLPVYWQKVRIDAPLAERRFAALLAARLRAAAAELGERLAEVQGPESVEEAHEARIAGKRVRYLLEPVLGLTEIATPAVKRLKKLQELLGELHDLDVLDVELTEALADAEREVQEQVAATLPADVPPAPIGAATASAPVAGGASPASSAPTDADAPSVVPGAEERRAEERRSAERRTSPRVARDPRPGLLAIARRARTRRTAVFEAIARDWLGREAAGLVASLDGVAAALEAETAARSAPVPMEIERKYLLRSLPHTMRGMPSVEIAQGWLPGTRLLERVREVRRGAQVQYFRTVKLGSGVARVELEEETTPELFAVLWPTTRERRIRKRRYKVTEGGLTWEIDQFAGRDLVLAEIELPTVDTEVSLPHWLAPYVVREVTDDAAYVNANLAQPEVDEPAPAAAAAPPRLAPAQVRTLLGERPRIVERAPASEAAAGDGATADAGAGDVAADDGVGARAATDDAR
jgi:CHAD domain-containing protein/CYTH domain-containing protein